MTTPLPEHPAHHYAAPISTDHVVDRFTSLLISFDFAEEFEILNFGRFHRAKRKRGIREFRAVYVSLWNLALEKSFPADRAVILDVFLQRLTTLFTLGPEDLAFLRRRIDVYTTLLTTGVSVSFLDIAENMLISVMQKPAVTKDLILRTSLHLRKTYTLFFNKLI